MTEVPKPITLAVIPFNEITDVVAEKYVQVPVVDEVGTTKSKLAAP
jgi:hypothetical protein